MLSRILKDREEAIAQRWVELVMATYPDQTASFLHREEDRFANPAGYAYREAALPLVRALSTGAVDPEAMEHLDRLMRLRSVQDWTAGQAVGVAPLLRQAALDVAGASILADGSEMLLELVERVDRLTRASFDVFIACRERLFEARLHERDRHQASLLRRAERVLEDCGQLSQWAPGKENPCPARD